MWKLLLIFPALVVFVALGAMMAQPAGTAQADAGPHQEGWGATPDGCAACHRVHRGMDGNLLLLNEAETLCLSCHGTGAVGSVLESTTGTDVSDGGALRSGGFLTARIETDDPSLPVSVYPPGSGHGSAADPFRDEGGPCLQNGVDDDGDTVIDDGCAPDIGVLAAGAGETAQSTHSTDGSPQTMWGNGDISDVANPGLEDYEMTCASCHDPHGNGNFRILREEPDGSGGDGHAIPDTYGYVYTTNNYFDMTFTGDYSTDDILIDTSAWCAQCHTRYWAAGRAPGGAAETSRVDSGDAIFKYRHTSSGVSWNSGGTPTNKNRACITCHASHGSNATAGTYSGAVPLPNGLAVSGSDNSHLLKMDNRGICQKCHNK